MRTPRGILNKNPGNLRYRKEWNWPHVVGIDDKQFAIFEAPEFGLAEFGRQLKRYRKRGIDTLVKVIPVYAPKEDHNDEAAYIASVERQTGINRNAPLDLDDRKVMEKLMRAFTRHEQGPAPPGLHDWYDDATYDRALDLLKPIAKSRTIGGAVGAAVSIGATAVTTVATQNAPDLATAHATASAIWPKYAPLITAVIGVAFCALVIYARLQARQEGKR